MMTGHPFSRNNIESFFHDRRGSATIWLIGAVCFVIVFLGVAFLLLKDSNPDRKPATIPAVSKREVREPIKPYTPSDKAPVEVAKVEEKAETPPENEQLERPDQPAREALEPLKTDPSKLPDAFADDASGEGILAPDLNEQAPVVAAGAEKTDEVSSLPSTAEKPPAIPEKEDLIETKLQPEDEKSVSNLPSEPSASVETKPTLPPEPPSPAEPQTDEKDLKELTVTVVKGNVRRGPSVKDEILFRVARGDKLQVIDQKGDWYAVLMDDDRSGWAHRSLFKMSSPTPEKKASAIPASDGKGVIQRIRTVVTDPKHAQIIFELNGYYPPEIMVIEGEAPRIVCDFFAVRLARGVKKTFPVTTDVVKWIRVGVHKDPKPKVRVVLDLNPGHNYEVEQFFFEKENYYALKINSAE
ncbi:MAG: SH3 domain-containing protein [Deltaproteobacteria bacterium]|nr:SH3 domain-containing protein [Deltaproteobacteria bacterium]